MARLKIRRILAGVCTVLMLSSSFNDSVMMAMAAENPAGEAVRETAEEVVGETTVTEEETSEEAQEAEEVEKEAITEVAEEEEVASDAARNDAESSEDGPLVVGNEVYLGGYLVGTIDGEGVMTIRKEWIQYSNGSFAGWADLKGVKFEADSELTLISRELFKECENLVSLDLTNCPKLTAIQESSFEGCTSLQSIKFHDNLQYIGKNAFKGCTSLGEISLNSGLIEMNEAAFSGCTSLATVIVKAANLKCKASSGSGIAKGIFANCNIKTITFAYDSSVLEGGNAGNNILVPGALFQGAKFAEDADIRIPYYIQEIGANAFEGSNLKEITFEHSVANPSALTTFGEKAFFGCSSLETVSFPDKVQTIGESAFSGCSKITTLVLPDSVTRMDSNAFAACTMLENLTLSNATSKIGSGVFQGCTSLPTVALPAGLTLTGVAEFRNCTSLASVTIADTLETIADSTFEGTALVNVVIPDHVSDLGASAFASCTSLQTVVLPKNLKEIKSGTFKGCEALVTADMPSCITTIGGSAFDGCMSYKLAVNADTGKRELPADLVSIGAYAFRDCQSFTYLIIPQLVTTIGAGAFSKCTVIETLTIQSNQIKTCGAGIFSQCLRLSTVEFPAGIEVIPANLFNQAQFNTTAKITIPKTVKTIGVSAFAGTASTVVNISEINFEEDSSLTTIGDGAFQYCTALDQFEIPVSVTDIGDSAFRGCIKIKSIVIPENVTSIGEYAFYECSILENITFNAKKVTTANKYIFGKCNVKNITIGNQVTVFPANLFNGAQFSGADSEVLVDKLTITIPASVKEIGEYALPNIVNLDKVIIEANSQLETIGDYAFYQCKNLTSINLPSCVKSIGSYAFDGCTLLGSDSVAGFTVPSALKTLGSGAFRSCTSLKSAVIPEGVTLINKEVFKGDTSLESVTLSGAVTEIGDGAFESCSALTAVMIPIGTQSIGATAFKGCTNLLKVSIPESVTSIGDDAFTGCTQAEFFVIPGSYAEQWLKDHGFTSKIKTLIKINYVLNKGVNAAGNPDGYNEGDTFTFLPATRPGYVFKGWYKEETFETEIQGVTGCTEELTIYAKWELDPESVTLIYADGDLIGYQDAQGMLTVYAATEDIPNNAFKNNVNAEEITEVAFEEGSKLIRVGSYAFSGCGKLTKIDFTNCAELTDIGAYAFENCTMLGNVKFNDTLQYIRKNAFFKCTSLEEITLVPGLIQMEENAFNTCSRLETVRVETANLTCKASTGSAAATNIFGGCNIKEIVFAIKDTGTDGNKNNIIVPGNLFNGAQFDADTVIVIPSVIQEIGEGAFQKSNLKEIVFQNEEASPSALSTIGKNAFSNCTSLSKVTFPSGLKNIGEAAFKGCKGLVEVEIPNSVTRMDAEAFYGCTGITALTLSNATTVIGDSVFYGCTGLTGLVLPEGLSLTGGAEFAACTNLRTVTIAESVEKLGASTFKGCTALSEIVIPDGVTEMGTSVFEGCTSLKTAVLSKGLTAIPINAFKSCTILETAEVPEGVAVIGASAFEDCGRLTSNVLPETLTDIGAKAYAGCKKFTEITIPEHVTTIGGGAFGESVTKVSCEKLTTLTIKTKELKSCGLGIFQGCSLKTITFPEGIETIPANLFSQANFTTGVRVTIPATVTEIGDNAFGGTAANAVNVAGIDFEEGSKLEIIGTGAFQYCTAIASFTIPESTMVIGENAFANCIKLPAIVIPENVVAIGKGAFMGCSVLTDVTYNAILVLTANKDIFKGCNIKKIIIGPNVAAFPANLFNGAQFSTNSETGDAEMVALMIPASVETIGEYALPNIANLQKVVVEEGSRLTSIGAYAFSQCINLTSINLPDGVTSIGNYAFDGCVLLGSDVTSEFTIPASLTTLGNGAFRGCTSIKNAQIPEGVTVINKETFKGDTALAAVAFAGAITKIDVSAFEGCTALEQIAIPNGTTAIGATAFKGCSGLRKVTIPASVTSIGKDAFSGCDSAVFYVVPGSYAEKWLTDNNLATKTQLLTKINYELNKGVNAPGNPAGYEEGDTFEFLPATRKGYLFRGWFLDSDFKTEIKGVEGCKGELTVYAKWEIETYHITYVLNGGTNDKDNPATYTVEESVTFKNPIQEGFKFEGWYTNPDDAKSLIKSISKGSTGDKTVYAKWSGIEADAPVASIESGTAVRAGTKVFLKSATPGALIYYTVDGTVPTVNSKLYADGIVINEKITIKAIAVKKGTLNSAVAEFTYDIIDEATDWGEILPADRAEYENATQVPKGIWVAGITDVEYTGASITFSDLRVYDNKTLLSAGTDYTIKYANNKLAADKNIGKKAPAINITAKGNYSGKVTVNFTIKPHDINSDDCTVDDIVNNLTGKLQKPVPVVMQGKTKLKAKKDYVVSYDDTTSGAYFSEGTYKITLEGKGNYTGKREVKFTIVNATPISKAKVSGVVAKNYTGTAVTQNPVVMVSGAMLTQGQDYELQYRNNVDAGTATMLVVGKGQYCGTKKVTFKINPYALMKKVTIGYKNVVPYTGKPYGVTGEGTGDGTDDGEDIGLTLNYMGKKLVQGQDYKCTYKKNTDAGTASVTITGMGGYSGVVKKSFKIAPADMSKLEVKFLDADGNVMDASAIGYEKGGTKPQVAVFFGEKKLVSGKDYTVTYENNTEKGNAKAIVKGKKNFTGSVTGRFTIVQQDLSELSILASDVQFKDEEGVIDTCVTTITGANGKALEQGTDFSVKYTYVNETKLLNGNVIKKAGETVGAKDIIPLETLIKVTATGKGNYKGEISTIIRVYQNSIAKAKITVKAQEYTGSAVQPGMDQITVKLGNIYLQAGDYEIVSYSNNVKKGTAKVTIRGIGNYGGLKTATFKIGQKKFLFF